MKAVGPFQTGQDMRCLSGSSAPSSCIIKNGILCSSTLLAKHLSFVLAAGPMHSQRRRICSKLRLKSFHSREDTCLVKRQLQQARMSADSKNLQTQLQSCREGSA